MGAESLKPYIHLAKYYETDQMAVIHHSNYIRWFEEARVDFLEQIGLGFDKVEAAGVYSPVLSIFCEYKSSVRFNEAVIIVPKLISFNGDGFRQRLLSVRVALKSPFSQTLHIAFHQPRLSAMKK